MTRRILVDADSCPQRVKNWLLSLAKKNQIDLFFAANKELVAEEIPNFKMIVCPKESQAADNWILQNAKAGDIIVTQDIPLAAALLKNNLTVMNGYGKIFDKSNVSRALKERELSMQMAELGLGTKKRDSYGQKEFELFAQSFDKLSKA